MINNNILLVSANKHTEPYPVYPLGLSYIKTYVDEKLAGFNIRIFDFNIDKTDGLINTISEFEPSVIGLSLRNIDDVDSYQRKYFVSEYKEITEIIRKYSNATLVIGGSGFSIFPEIIFNLINPDFGITGEGEESFYELIQSFRDNSGYHDIPGLLYKKDGKLFHNKRQRYFNNLNLRFDDGLADFYWKCSGMLNVQSKRGCPYKCIYCTYPLIEGSKVRVLEPERIINALSDLYFNKGINYVFFTDSVFNISNEYNYKLAEKIIESEMELKWGGYFTISNLDEKLLKILKRSGLTHIEFGTESISDTVLKHYGKNFTADDVLRISELCNKYDIAFAHFLILGGYGETDKTLDETFSNASKIKNTVFFPYVGMRIYPGTKLQKLATEEGKISPEESLLEPKYYISDNITLSSVKERAFMTKKRWVFPDEDLSEAMKKMRLKNKKGPLWENLIR